jgi:hypothetical protein
MTDVIGTGVVAPAQGTLDTQGQLAAVLAQGQEQQPQTGTVDANAIPPQEGQPANPNLVTLDLSNPVDITKIPAVSQMQQALQKQINEIRAAAEAKEMELLRIQQEREQANTLTPEQEIESIRVKFEQQWNSLPPAQKTEATQKALEAEYFRRQNEVLNRQVQQTSERYETERDVQLWDALYAPLARSPLAQAIQGLERQALMEAKGNRNSRTFLERRQDLFVEKIAMPFIAATLQRAQTNQANPPAQQVVAPVVQAAPTAPGVVLPSMGGAPQSSSMAALMSGDMNALRQMGFLKD